MSNDDLSPDDKQRMTEMLVAGKRIRAIKLYRDITGQSLKESMQFFDKLSVELSSEYPELTTSKNVGTTSILSRRVRKALDEHRASGEDVLFCLRGDHKQALIALPSRLLIVKPGFMAGVTFGVQVTTFMYEDISGIEVHTGLFIGFIAISTASYQSTAEKSRWSMSGDRDPKSVSNCLPISKDNLKHYQPFLERLRSLIKQAKSGGNSNSTSQSLVDQLKQLTDLLASGALTQEEFDRAKSRILDEG